MLELVLHYPTRSEEDGHNILSNFIVRLISAKKQGPGAGAHLRGTLLALRQEPLFARQADTTGSLGGARGASARRSR